MIEFSVAIIICVGIIFGVFLIRKLYMNDKSKNVGYIIVPCSNSTENLEKLIRAYYWEEVFENELYSREIVIVLMDKSQNTFLAKRLAQQFSIVSTVDITGLEDFLKKREFKCNG